jgi:hypothetical protein
MSTTFGVTYVTLQESFFPGQTFSPTSRPKAATVTTIIEEQAALLAGALRAEGASAAGIAADNTSDAYKWCASTLKLLAAPLVAQAGVTGVDDAVVDDWQEQGLSRLRALDEKGTAILGETGVATPSTPSNGPASHIGAYGLELPDNEDASQLDVVRIFRMGDKL